MEGDRSLSMLFFSFQEKLNFQVEIDTLRAKLIEEETTHQKLQEQFLVEKLKRVNTPNATDEEIKNDSQEIIKGPCSHRCPSSTSSLFSFADLEKKLDLERQALKRANEELMQVQKKARMLEMDLKQITTTYNQLSYDHELFKQSNEQIIEQMESDHQRRNQYDKDLKYLQQQFSNAVNQEKQAQNEVNQTRQENQRLSDELRTLGQDYENMKTKLIDFEEQVEGEVTLLSHRNDFTTCLSSSRE